MEEQEENKGSKGIYHQIKQNANIVDFDIEKFKKDFSSFFYPDDKQVKVAVVGTENECRKTLKIFSSMVLKQHLISLGFEQKLPWLFVDDFYQITYLDSDSYGFEMWSITSLRYDSVNFRGRIRSVEEFNLIFALAKEDYNLTDEEIKMLK